MHVTKELLLNNKEGFTFLGPQNDLIQYLAEQGLKPDGCVFVNIVLESLDLVLFLVQLEVDRVKLAREFFLEVPEVALVRFVGVQLDQTPLDLVKMAPQLVKHILKGLIPT